ncbi:hypothetical protein BGW39_004566 [Mortierella sp. 14UC]|nr:hypothetical protein BGW39_004566 [Mortierella sp. 14UC]
MVLDLDELLHALATNSPLPTNNSSAIPRTRQGTTESAQATPDTPASACDRFFALPELITYLVNNILDPQQLSILMQCSKLLKAICKPRFYRDVDLTGVKGLDRADSIPAMQALAKNTRLVRSIKADIIFAVHYVTSVIIGRDDALKAQGKPAKIPNLLGVPSAVKSTRFTAMTNLTSLYLSMDVAHGYEMRPFYMPDVESNVRRTAHLAWIYNLSPNLVDIKLEFWQVWEYQDIQDFPKSIHLLSKLKNLTLRIALHRQHWHHFASTMYFCAPHSLQKLRIEYVDMADMMHGPPSHVFGPAYADEAAERRKSRRGNAGWKKAAPRRQGPLSELKVLAVPGLLVDTKGEFAFYLEQSPNLEHLSIPQLDRTIKVNDVLQLVHQHCPKLNSIAGNEIQMEQVAKIMPGAILLLPEQTLTQIDWTGFKEDPSLDYRKLLKRHSTTIQRIYMNLCRDISSKTIQAVLTECSGLEEFIVLAHSWNCSTKIDLEDAVKPWVCTRLTKLTLRVAFPDLRPALIGRAATLKPYYERASPFFLTWEEREQFSQLEKLYTNIGSLTRLEELTLWAKPIPPANANPQVIADNGPPDDWWISYRFYSFPGLLSLGDTKIGRPGYLHLLKGLKNLRVLMGSVSIDARETTKTVWWDEIEYMEKHWPKLMKTEFLQHHKAIVDGTSWHAPIAWLLTRRPRGFTQSMYGMPALQRSGC